MVNVLVTCAGKGQRFLDQKIKMPKPLISVSHPNNPVSEPMVKITTDSLPFIEKLAPQRIAFAVLQEHIDDWSIGTRLMTMYNEPVIIPFEKVTRGNLETAYQSVEYLIKNSGWSSDDPILILDSDNKYDGSNFMKFIGSRRKKEFAAVCYFEPLDEKTHWCFAQMEGKRVYNLLEKQSNALELGGKPMVGVFYFSSAQLFLDAAEAVFFSEEARAGEYYMSQVVHHLISKNVWVYGHEVTDVNPLGTPADVNKYEQNQIRIAIDLDDTILHCKAADEEYGNEKPQARAIEILKRWKAQGHYIIIHTARNARTCEGNLGKILARQGLTTLQWLEDNEVPYDEIWWSKPHADIFIDDKGFRHTPGDWQSTELAVLRFIEGGKP